MRRRYIYVLLFALPALLVAALIALALFGAAAGALWIFVYGDNPWPKWTETALPAAFAVAFMVLWLAFLTLAYHAGRKQEASAAFNAAHAWAAAAVSVLVVLVMVGYEWRVGNIGAPSPGEACATYCQARGFLGSGTPPRNAAEQTCSCFDAQGREAVKIPLGDAAAPRGR